MLTHFGLPLMGAIFCFYYTFFFLKSTKSLEDLPVSKVRSAAQGFVELNGYGVALPDAITEGKLERTPCLWYYYQVEEYCTVTQDNTTTTNCWKIIEQDISLAPFLFRDETGECVIFPRGAEILAVNKTCFQGNTRTPLNPPSVWWQRFLSHGVYRYTEYRLELQQPLSITGMFYSYNPKSPLASDENFELSHFLNESNTTTVNLLIQNGLEKDQKYLISALSTKKIALRYRLQSFLFFMAFLFFIFITTRNTFPIIEKTLNNVHTQQLIRTITRAIA